MPPVSGNPLVARHYQAQRGLVARLERELAASGYSDARARALAAKLAAEYSAASAALARDYYADMRDQAGIRDRFRIPVEAARSADSALDYLDKAVTTDRALGPVAGMLVSDAGRGQLFSAMKADPRSRRWARVTAGQACAFCLMLATRGAVYRSDDTADFNAHPGCHCTIHPVFRGVPYEPTAAIRQAQSTWSEATGGLSGRDALNAFRRAIG